LLLISVKNPSPLYGYFLKIQPFIIFIGPFPYAPVTEGGLIKRDLPRRKPKHITELFLKLTVMGLALKKIFNELQND